MINTYIKQTFYNPDFLQYIGTESPAPCRIGHQQYHFMPFFFHWGSKFLVLEMYNYN